MKTVLSLSILMVLLIAGCTQAPPAANNSSAPNQSAACPTDAKICPDGSAVGRVGPNCEFAPCPAVNQTTNTTPPVQPSGPMSQADALAIAQNSSCASAGEVSVLGTYNNNSGTWWFDITAMNTSCNPACVVSANGSAEINWRCTGLIMYTVKSANTSLGTILVDGDGFTLYTFSSDSANKSTCFGGCAQNWPALVLTSDTIKVPSTVPGSFGAFARDNTSIQVTYNGMPLYRYAGDQNPGDTNGQGIGGKWYVVNVSG